jgi:hypothetical protein
MLLRSLSPQLPALALTALLALQSARPTDVTSIAIGEAVDRAPVKRLGINLSGQTYYDSGQMLSNLVFRNPGFEGETWQTILRCKQASASSCTDQNQYTVWPPDFLKDAHFEFLSGDAKGNAGTVRSSTAAANGSGVTLTFNALTTTPAANDFLLVRLDKPGDAQAGWWTELRGEARLSTEFKDLAHDTLGKQALRIEATGPGQSAAILSYFDSTAGHSFVRLHGTHHLSFRAKGLAGNREVQVQLQRLDTVHGTIPFFDRAVSLLPIWQEFAFDFPTDEPASAVGTVALAFRVSGASILLDDVSLTGTSSPGNPTAFRDEVVAALRDLHPGVLRYMDNGTDFGSSLDTMLARPFARRRAGYSTQTTQQDDIPIGLEEFLVLAQAVGAEPWYTMPAGTTPTEARALIEFLAAPASAPYGAVRANLGHTKPWTEVFPVIHLELGNEQWNTGSFYGAAIGDPAVYGQRAAEVFAAARSHPAFRAGSFDLILGGWAANDWWTGQELSHSSGFDSTAVAPYLFASFNDASSSEAIFGPMLAQPEALDSRSSGAMARQLEAARKASPPANLAVYEVNLGTMSGSASQAAIDSAIPSMGAGLATIDHMLLMMRDLGVSTQALFALPEFSNGFTAASGTKQTVPLWGAVVDMGGATNLRRPQFLAEKLANEAIGPTLLSTSATGANPAWNQPKSANDKIELRGAHLIQSFAFADKDRRSVILLNLCRTDALPVTFTGSNAPSGSVQQSRLTAARITDNNETAAKVKIERSALTQFNPSNTYLLPPFSMTVLTWRAP